MTIAEGLIAGVIAGSFMGAASWGGHRLGWFKSNLISIDGQFATRLLHLKSTPPWTYALGVPMHLVTSAIFGIIYAGMVRVLDVRAESALVILPYVVVLWMGMLFSALPVAGAGLLGRKVGPNVWAEQLVIHAVFGAVFWWTLTWL